MNWHYSDKAVRPQQWDDLAASPGATFFHSRAWAEVLASTFRGWKPSPVVTEFSDGNVALLPLMSKVGIFGVEIYRESMVPGVYGGPVFLKPPTDEHWDGISSVIQSIPNLLMIGNPFLSQPRSLPFTATMWTHVLDLSGGIDSVLRRFRKGHKAAVKAAERSGLEVEIATSPEDISEYFRIYEQTLKRWGRIARGFYPAQLFMNLFSLPGYGENVKLWLAKHNGVVIGGIWVFYHNDHAVYWHGATDTPYLSYHANHLLVTAAIKDSCNKALRWFDFNPSGGLKGVEHFKRGFGAEPRTFFSYRHLGPLGKAFRVKRHLQESLLKACSL
jgi:CelD/BcsL family acetyltransferase involved in cellulose biosynthesis